MVRYGPGDGERELGRWVVGVPWGARDLSCYGGTLVLTDRRLLFTPIVPFLFRRVGHSAGLGEVAAAHAVGTQRIRLTGPTGGHRDYLVAASRFATVWDPANTAVRDHAVETIRRAIGNTGG